MTSGALSSLTLILGSDFLIESLPKAIRDPMKKCAWCGRGHSLEAVTCWECGGNEFQNTNSPRTKPKPTVSVNVDCVCGARLRINFVATKTYRCPECDAYFTLDQTNRVHFRYRDWPPDDQPDSGPSPKQPGAPADDPYSILGVPSGASLDEIKSAYRERIKEYHPDRVATLGAELRALAERKTKEINLAFQEISNAHRL